jgi:8-oxo-dGTP pyrophosphatase MutT (NUDIX family)
MSSRAQAGVIPFRRRKDTIEICLIRTRGRKKWKIPKGFVDPGETAEQAALKEAWEEAGLEGQLADITVGSYLYEKWGMELTVSVYLMEVSGEHEEWEESTFRERNWVPLVTALELLQDHPVFPLLEGASEKLDKKKRQR